MNSNWVRIYSGDKLHQIEILKAFLQDHSIQAVSVNKTDSMNTFLSNGEIEIFVKGEDAIRAKKLLEENPF